MLDEGGTLDEDAPDGPFEDGALDRFAAEETTIVEDEGVSICTEDLVRMDKERRSEKTCVRSCGRRARRGARYRGERGCKESRDIERIIQGKEGS